ncbi:MAG: hypothetical protein NWE80_01495 [Candidatus Bathyarchaeota archaeon]|nr:hypothetical protein [Candidatus Bathyarchaeota archaeon]
MRKLTIILLITVLGASCFSAFLSQTYAQESTEPTPSPLPPPPIMRWTRFRGAVTQWGDDPYEGSITVNTRVPIYPPETGVDPSQTTSKPPPRFRPRVTVDVFWSNERPPITMDPKPVGQVTFTHYKARLVWLIAIRGRQEAMNLNITGIWNVNMVKVTSEFDEEGVRVKTEIEVTPIVTRAKGQLRVTEDWKKFDIEIEGVDTLEGIGKGMMTTTRMMNRFSFLGGFRPTILDLFRLMRCFRTMPGFGNYNPELDYNSDSKIDVADLTTVAANM